MGLGGTGWDEDSGILFCAGYGGRIWEGRASIHTIHHIPSPPALMGHGWAGSLDHILSLLCLLRERARRAGYERRATDGGGMRIVIKKNVKRAMVPPLGIHVS
jgi:hypothetical protein